MIEIERKIEGKKLELFWNGFGLTKESAYEAIVDGLKTGRVVVHDGNEFHTDEVRAIAIANILRDLLTSKGMELPVLEIVRTRDEDVLTQAKEDGCLIFDVGCGPFDHHMPVSESAIRETGERYAAAGLVWAAVGDVITGDPELTRKIDKAIILGNDMADTGEYTSGGFILEQYLSPTIKEDYSKMMENMLFSIMVEKVMLVRAIKHFQDNAAVIREANELLEQLIPEAEKTGVLYLPKYIPWHDLVIPTKIKIVVVDKTERGETDKWSATVVPIAKDTFDSKIYFPKEMNGNVIAGLRNEELRKASGIQGLNFLHNERWFATAETKEAIDALVNYTIQNC